MNTANGFDHIWDEMRPCLASLRESDVVEAARRIHEAPRVFLAGAGRSGLLIRMFAMRLAQAGLVVHVAGEATTPALTAGDLLIIASGSGATATMQVLAAKAVEKGATLLLITYADNASLADQAGHVVRIPVQRDANRPGGLAGMQFLGTLFDQCLLLTTDRLVAEVARLRGQTGKDLQQRHANLE